MWVKKLDEFMSDIIEKHLYVGQVVLFLQNAQKAGYKQDEALRRLREHARSRKWSMDAPTVNP